MEFLTRLTSEEKPTLIGLVADELGVRLEHVPEGFVCEYFSEASPVVVTWQGRASIPADQFDLMVTMARGADPIPVDPLPIEDGS